MEMKTYDVMNLLKEKGYGDVDVCTLLTVFDATDVIETVITKEGLVHKWEDKTDLIGVLNTNITPLQTIKRCKKVARRNEIIKMVMESESRIFPECVEEFIDVTNVCYILGDFGLLEFIDKDHKRSYMANGVPTEIYGDD